MNNGGTNAQPTPGPTANYAPNATDGSDAQNGNGAAGLTNNGDATNNGATGNTAATTDGALNPFDWANGAADIEKAIGRISEISDARVVVTNSTALVGVKFDNAYKGEITERIREMVAAEVLRADPSIQTVAVTASEDDVNKVYVLSEQIRAGRNADELSAEINAIVRNATTLR
jgi:YhcN/YlaJ family sporulation lipoprotein